MKTILALLNRFNVHPNGKIGWIDMRHSMPIAFVIAVNRCPDCDEVSIVAEAQLLFFGIAGVLSFGGHPHKNEDATPTVRMVKGSLEDIFLHWIMATHKPSSAEKLQELAHKDDIQAEFLKFMDLDDDYEIMGGSNEQEKS